jgi:putative ABC transport system ATP-binding protein
MTEYSLQHVSRTFVQGSATITALHDVNMLIGAGETVAIMGPSGSGKTTLLHLLGGLDRPSAGQIYYGAIELAKCNESALNRLRVTDFGFVFQQSHLIATLNARQQIDLALVAAGVGRSERNSRTSKLLDDVGLGSRRYHLPGQLSGGEQQRVALARALANRPKVILADEPTGNLDYNTAQSVLDLIFGSKPDQTVVVVTHDDHVASRASRIIELIGGELVGDWSN